MPISEVFNMDCMEGMKQYPDKYFELAIVDPPYGNNLSGGRSIKNGFNPNINWNKCTKGWNLNIPDPEYFTELFRVSKNQIIWGGNYFTKYLPPSECWLIWDKGQRDFSFADGEMAWTSFDKAMRIYLLHRATANQEIKLHPTQKPIKLYKWLLSNYAICQQCKNEKIVIDDDFTKETIPCESCNGSFKILDTHLGSGSSRIAAYEMGFDFIGYELDKDYFDASVKRFEQYKAQLKLFA